MPVLPAPALALGAYSGRERISYWNGIRRLRSIHLFTASGCACIRTAIHIRGEWMAKSVLVVLLVLGIEVPEIFDHVTARCDIHWASIASHRVRRENACH